MDLSLLICATALWASSSPVPEGMDSSIPHGFVPAGKHASDCSTVLFQSGVERPRPLYRGEDTAFSVDCRHVQCPTTTSSSALFGNPISKPSVWLLRVSYSARSMIYFKSTIFFSYLCCIGNYKSHIN